MHDRQTVSPLNAFWEVPATLPRRSLKTETAGTGSASLFAPEPQKHVESAERETVELTS
jgi:hypothetical protein